jgi:hypothetical protein
MDAKKELRARLLSNPSFEKTYGRVELASVELNRLVLKTDSNSRVTLTGPFTPNDWASLLGKSVVVGTKAGQSTQIFEFNHPQEKRVVLKEVTSLSPGDTATREAWDEAYAYWEKIFDRMIVDKNVPLSIVGRRFQIGSNLESRILDHLDLDEVQTNQEFTFTQFRKFYRFIISKEFRLFIKDLRYEIRRGQPFGATKKKKRGPWVRFISVPMGGQSKWDR